jgi:hypothetical protein
MKVDVDTHMEMLHHKLDASEASVKETVEKGAGGGHPWAMYLVFFFVGIVLMNVVRTLRKGSQPKKYI